LRAALAARVPSIMAREYARLETTMPALIHASPIHATHDTPMQIGDSFGDACRHCGSTLIIIAPPSSSGRCAVCSPEAKAWGERDAERRLRRLRTAA
jgi:hypothetical protein